MGEVKINDESVTTATISNKAFKLAVWAETIAIPALTKAKELAGEGEGICNTIWDVLEEALKELPK